METFFNRYLSFDFAVGAIITTIGILTYFEASSFPTLPNNHVGPGTFPSMIALLMIPCGITILVKSLIQPFKETDIELKQVLFAFSATLLTPVLCILLAEVLGFSRVSFLTTLIFLQIIRKEKLIQNVLIALLTTTTLCYVFRVYLLVPLPEGTIF